MLAPRPGKRAHGILKRTSMVQSYLDERRRYWDQFAETLDRWQGIRGYYQRRLADIYRLLIPPGMRVLELGSGQGDLLASLRPSRGVGVDLSPAMIARARLRHPALEFIEVDAHQFSPREPFDFVLLSDLVNELWDVQQVLERIAE